LKRQREVTLLRGKTNGRQLLVQNKWNQVLSQNLQKTKKTPFHPTALTNKLMILYNSPMNYYIHHTSEEPKWMKKKLDLLLKNKTLHFEK